MRLIAVLIIFIFVATIAYVQINDAVQFDVSMRVQEYPAVAGISKELLNFFKTLYDKNNLLKIRPQPQPTIPHIIHHIWLGSELPEKFQNYYSSWHEHHPNWTFIFWTDNASNFSKGDVGARSWTEVQKLLNESHKRIVVDVRELKFKNRNYFDMSTNYGERSDLLRYAILYRIGGLYVDTDFECLKPLDEFHYRYDLYTGIQPFDTNAVQLGIGLIGSRPKHPVLKHAIDTIQNDAHLRQIILKTGPIHFTRSFCALAGRNGMRDCAFPSSYFYPMGYEQQNSSPDLWLRPESYAVHRWAGSWLKASGKIL
jgi:mannosyltransferase OCH1-like enzyme